MRPPVSLGAISPRQRLATATCLLALLFVLWQTPVASGLVRGAALATVLALWLATLVFWWRRRLVRAVCLALPAAGVLLATLPSRARDEAALRAAYVRTLGSYEGTKYVWGGENWRGIDCSGLIRRGLIDATLAESLHRLDPGLLRANLSLRWHDASARALRDGHRGIIAARFSVPSLRDTDPRRLDAGDLAVTADGLHIMAHLGGGEWIEADPGAGHVVRLRPGDTSPWLRVPVVILRWDWSAL